MKKSNTFLKVCREIEVEKWDKEKAYFLVKLKLTFLINRVKL